MTEYPAALDLSTPRRVHIVGIGGAGMNAIATVLARMGHRVSGSDLKSSAGLERLRALGVVVDVGHSAQHVGADVEAVTISTAIPATNPEVRVALDRGLPVLRRAETLAAIAATRRSVAVSGTHGKTTTTSMLAMILVEAGWHPSFIVGGDLNEVGGGAAWDVGEHFVVEADESDGTFVELGAHDVLVTNVEPDHLDHHGSFAALTAAFARFLRDAPGVRVVCADAPLAAELGASVGAVTYGHSRLADWCIQDLALGRAWSTFAVSHEGVEQGRLRVPMPGAHNAANAVGALAMACSLGVPFAAGAAALGRFGGVARRFEFRGTKGGVTYVDDYAHNPGKVAAVLAGARAGGWGRVVCVFQPHRYSRTVDLLDLWGEAFVDADVVAITGIYGAGEAARPGVTGQLVVDTILAIHPAADVTFVAHRADLHPWLDRVLRPGDLCLTLGAGDLTSFPDERLGGSSPGGLAVGSD